MKKYIAPEVEIKRFAVESIMNGSEVDLVISEDSKSATNGVATLDYNSLFTIN